MSSPMKIRGSLAGRSSAGRSPARGSLAHKLMIYSGLFTFLLLIVFWSILYWALRNGLRQQDHELIQDRIRAIKILLQEEHGPSERLRRRIENDWFEQNYARLLIRLLGPDKKVIFETPHLSGEYSMVLDGLEFPAARGPDEGSLNRVEMESHVFETTVAEIPISGVLGNQATGSYFAKIALERTSEQRLLSHFRTFFIYLLAIGGLASLWIGRQMTRVALLPIRDFSHLAARINSEQLGGRLKEENFPEEFQELAQTLNGMLDRLADSFARLTQFSEDMAHELRTPVNNLLGSMEVALAKERSVSEYRNVLGSGIEECERLRRIIESLLFIARSADPNSAVQKQTLKLEDELREIVSFYEVSAEEKNISLELAIESSLEIMAERTLLQRAIGNLLSNSIRHSPQNSTIRLSAGLELNKIVISVSDIGGGIPADALKRIGERFFRVEPSRSKVYGGTGLGLSIAKSIAKVHGGDMYVTSQDGVGTTVKLVFPILQS